MLWRIRKFTLNSNPKKSAALCKFNQMEIIYDFKNVDSFRIAVLECRAFIYNFNGIQAFYKFECNTNLFVCLFKYVYLAYSVSSISDHKNMHYLGVFKGISQMIENQNFGFLICKSFELQPI